ncbi:MAG: hypothetical protein ACEQSL_05075, partial [Sediminibacterium sp.]
HVAVGLELMLAVLNYLNDYKITHDDFSYLGLVKKYQLMLNGKANTPPLLWRNENQSHKVASGLSLFKNQHKKAS